MRSSSGSRQGKDNVFNKVNDIGGLLVFALQPAQRIGARFSFVEPTVNIDFIRGLAYNIIVVEIVLDAGRFVMEYLSIKQTAEKWGITVRRIQVLCAEERIPGAIKIGSYWAIPADAEKPCDQRIKSGKYRKESVG